MNTALELPVEEVMQPVCKRVAKRAKLLFFPHPDEQGEFTRTVKAVERLRVMRLLSIMEDIHGSPNVRKACLYHAAQLKRDGMGRGYGPDNLRRLYQRFVASGGDWRVLVNGSRNRTDGLGKRADFLRFWRMLCDRHQRVLTSAWRELREIYQTRFDGRRNFYKSIPGYDEWPEADPHTGMPEGWTFRNLARHAPDLYERTAARVGVMKASGQGRKARFSRENLRPMQQISFDDHEFNVKVLYPGQKATLRPRCFAAHDVASNDCVRIVIKHTLWDEDEEKKKALNETDFMWFVIFLLVEIGIHPEGCEFLVEHGTAAIRGDNVKPPRPLNHPDRTDLEARIHRVTGGLVTIKRSGRAHQPAHPGQFAAPSGGNFRFKPIEQYWRMLDDRLDHLPGNVGKDREHNPEAMDKEERYIKKMLASASDLPWAQARHYQLPWLTFDEFCQHVWKVADSISDEPEHACGQWEKSGFVVKEFFLPVAMTAPGNPAFALCGNPVGDFIHPTPTAPSAVSFEGSTGAWLPLERLPDTLRELGEERGRPLLALLEAPGGALVRARRMTRREARETVPQLRRFPRSAIPLLVDRRHAVRGGEPLTVRGGEFTFDDQRVSPDPLVFQAVDSTGQPLREGTRCVCYVNPLAPAFLIACDLEGRVVGECPAHLPADRTDAAAVARESGVPGQFRAAKLADMRERNAEGGAVWEFLKRHNAEVGGGAHRTEADKAGDRRLRKFEGGAEELLISEPVSAEPVEEFSNEALL